MNLPIPSARISPLRQRLIDDMTMRRLSSQTQRNYIRDVGRLVRHSFRLNGQVGGDRESRRAR